MSENEKISILSAAPADLSSIVDYQEDSVVSREVVKGKTGTLSVFSFDAGEGLSEHTAPFDAMVLILDGKAEITISGKPLLLGKGEAVVMPANQSHALKAIERFKMLLIMIKS